MNESMTITLPVGALEGTAAILSTWLVAEGDQVRKGDPILELETDKVSMEVCAENDGAIGKILATSGDNVDEKTILGYLNCGEQSLVDKVAADKSSSPVANDALQNESVVDVVKYDVADDDSKRHLIGPAVRKLLRKHNLNLSLIDGTGKGGRVTRDDILAFVDTQIGKEQSNSSASIQAEKSHGVKSKLVPHTSMRKKIANHMVESLLHTSPHVTSVFEMDMGRIIEHRQLCKMGFEEAGVKLTFTAYFLAASAKAMQKVPVVNSRFHDDCLEIFEDINIGVGTALGDDGLIVPVVKKVQEKNLFEIASALQQQTDKARQGKLVAADMRDGTFTISNHGVSGSLFATPIIINQPQVAILGIGKLEKRAVVEEVNGEDTIVIRPKCYVSLSIDHRALDAYQTNLFLSHFVEVIENWGK
ncbi:MULTISPECIES: dihydrolipoamide acetyltransferase family protein [Marinomonas]|uniref:Dihydrolipoamide acetyltransferase component of pyruvate dehydrogenase complex n=1 Tax=Marinomonas arctica TaxID=383750 RepID=A0A7H1J9W4_9GAMM|nr:MULTISPECIES: 2-oxo acid dehydrogenase subunit E2 [Marinomonas]MCS7485395.1 dihydrolipoamide succinyltransferase [Marinomonas sp. BSi20414]QNT07280.1 2-oxo acid dehydrogenase subunit E2 [Marinomonas arctica]GGN25048.1 dihydrolipoamide acetyltransferase component of pyruvate dehydrogenase complex [Marinomonas arctica]